MFAFEPAHVATSNRTTSRNNRTVVARKSKTEVLLRPLTGTNILETRFWQRPNQGLLSRAGTHANAATPKNIERKAKMPIINRAETAKQRYARLICVPFPVRDINVLQAKVFAGQTKVYRVTSAKRGRQNWLAKTPADLCGAMSSATNSLSIQEKKKLLSSPPLGTLLGGKRQRKITHGSPPLWISTKEKRKPTR